MGTAPAVRAGLSLANAALRLAFAPVCAVCTSPLATPLDGCVCAGCWAAIAAPPHVAWPSGLITAAAAAGDYAGSLRQIIHAFKYDGRRSLAGRLGQLMRAQGHDVLQDVTCAIPVPLHPWRRMHRGFNQAADLAETLAVPVAPILWRRQRTAPQADLTAAQRRHNVHDAFGLSPFLSRRQRDRLRGAIVLLVDDVRTTGATLHACAEALEPLGVRDVRALTAAVRGHEATGLSSGGGTYASSGSTAANTSSATSRRSRSASRRTQLSVT
jgi:ComF family protein